MRGSITGNRMPWGIYSSDNSALIGYRDKKFEMVSSVFLADYDRGLPGVSSKMGLDLSKNHSTYQDDSYVRPASLSTLLILKY